MSVNKIKYDHMKCFFDTFSDNAGMSKMDSIFVLYQKALGCGGDQVAETGQNYGFVQLKR